MHIVSVPKYSIGWRLHFREEFIVPNVGYGVVVSQGETCHICIMRGRLFQTSLEPFSFPEVSQVFGDKGLPMSIHYRSARTHTAVDLYKQRRRLFTKRRVLL